MEEIIDKIKLEIVTNRTLEMTHGGSTYYFPLEQKREKPSKIDTKHFKEFIKKGRLDL